MVKFANFLACAPTLLRALAEKLHPEIEQFVEKAHAHLNGQPFLLQTVFQETVQRSEVSPDVAFGEALENLPYLVAGHLQGIFSKVIGSAGLTKKVAMMIQQGYTDLSPADSDCSFLQILGLAKRQGSRLVFRNGLYADVARLSPQIVPMAHTQSAQTAVFGIQKGDLGFMKSPDLREICFTAYDGAAKAHCAGSYRLALTGFGSAMEAMLLDLLSGLHATELQTAVAAASAQRDHARRPQFSQYEDRTNAMTWRLVNLIKVAMQVKVGAKPPEPSHALREWRNLVHPAATIQHFVNESDLQPESVAASALFAILLRDIS